MAVTELDSTQTGLNPLAFAGEIEGAQKVGLPAIYSAVSLLFGNLGVEAAQGEPDADPRHLAAMQITGILQRAQGQDDKEGLLGSFDNLVYEELLFRTGNPNLLDDFPDAAERVEAGMRAVVSFVTLLKYGSVISTPFVEVSRKPFAETLLSGLGGDALLLTEQAVTLFAGAGLPFVPGQAQATAN